MSNKLKGKTLSERLAELANPTPTFVDPEDEYNEDTKAQLDRYDDEYQMSDIPSKTKNVKTKSNLRQANSELLAVSDKRYAGKRVSRKDLEEEEDDDEASFEEESSEEDEEDIQMFNSKMKKDKKDTSIPLKSKKAQQGIDSQQSSEDEDLGEEEDDESGDQMDEEEEGEEEEEGDSDENDDEFGSDEEEEGADVQSIDDNEDGEEEVEKSSKNSHDSDIKKGKSIQNQLSLWDHLLECRIKMHKSVNLCNQLPQGPSNFKLFSKTSGENHFGTAVQGAQTAFKSMLDSCLELQDLLLKSNPQTKSLIKKSNGASKEESDEEIPSDTEDEIESEKDDEDEDGAPARKRMKVSEYEKEISERHKRFQDFCNRTLNMWNEKTRLASGRLNAKSGGFGAFDQSILKQIEGILADKQRLINRTRIKRSTYRILGSQPKSKEVVPPPNSENMDDPSIRQDGKTVDEDEFDFEIYDDDDFYHQLLRELIEKRTGEGGSNQIALGRQWLEIQKLRSKAKRKVDSKASKGRRLRYQVHPKLVSFMAPYPENSWNDVAKNELFASLFGTGAPVR